MKILAFDTAMNACSVALLDGADVCAHIHEKRRRGHAEALLPMIESVLRDSGFSYDMLDMIAVSVGPGTFTGLRIGLAAARGMALAAGKPLLGITSLEALAASVPVELAAGRPVAVASDARRGEIYLQIFDRLDGAPMIAPRTEAMAIRPQEALSRLGGRPAVLIGSGAPLLAELAEFDGDLWPIPDLDPDPDALHLARLAAARGLPAPDAPPPAPVYLRAPDAKLPGGVDYLPANDG